jgi:CheY-like chemotaxis protein
VTTRVLVVDDNTAFRATARRVLEHGGFDVVAEAATGAGAIEEAQRHGPDLVLLDVQLPDIDGFQVADHLARFDQPPAVILVSSLDSRDFGALVDDSPVLGFIPKAELSTAAIDDLFGRAR